MELLGQKVKEDGVVIDEKILKVDGFLNHQIDAKLMNEVGRTFYEQFKDKGITKILTIEASGIAPAIMAALHFDVPCLFAKKAKPSTLTMVIMKHLFIHLLKIKQVRSLFQKNFYQKKILYSSSMTF